jgi:hypothetical protein
MLGLSASAALAASITMIIRLPMITTTTGMVADGCALGDVSSDVCVCVCGIV